MGPSSRPNNGDPKGDVLAWNQPVNPDMVTLARESRGMTQSELAAKAGVSQGLLSRAESGQYPISDALLKSLAVALHYPESFFLRSDPIYGPGTSEFYHRKRESAPQRTLDQLHALINIRRMEIHRLLRAAEIENVNFPRIDPEEFDGSVEEVARAIRATWRLPRGPIKNVTQAIEDAGGIIVRFPFGTRRVDAVSWWVPKMPPLFFVNSEMPTDRCRLTLCHEIGHLVMHQTPRPEMEDEANRFAAELLMPASDIRPQLHNVDVHRLAALKPYWKVSMQALLRRAADLHAISSSAAKSIWVQMGRAGYRIREPAELDITPEEPTLLEEMVNLHLGDLGYDLPQLSAALDLHEDEASREYRLRRPQGSAAGRFRVVK